MTKMLCKCCCWEGGLSQALGMELGFPGLGEEGLNVWIYGGGLAWGVAPPHPRVHVCACVHTLLD